MINLYDTSHCLGFLIFFRKMPYLWAYKGSNRGEFRFWSRSGLGQKRAGTGTCPYGMC
jgi:hypothetical protein